MHPEPEQLRPQFYVTRQNGRMVALIAMDELPSTINIRHVSRTLSPYDIYGMIGVGTFDARHRQHVVDNVSNNRYNLATSHSQPGLSMITRSPLATDYSRPPSYQHSIQSGSHPSMMSPLPKAYGIQEQAPDSLKSATFNNPSLNTANPYHIVDRHATNLIPNNTSTMTDRTRLDDTKSEIDTNTDINNAPSRTTDRTPLPSWHDPTTIPPPRSSAPGVKEYCSYWLRHGECDYAQQGCLYRHEMPLDRGMLARLGLRDIPRWYREKHGLGSFLAVGSGGVDKNIGSSGVGAGENIGSGGAGDDTGADDRGAGSQGVRETYVGENRRGKKATSRLDGNWRAGGDCGGRGSERRGETGGGETEAGYGQREENGGGNGRGCGVGNVRTVVATPPAPVSTRKMSTTDTHQATSTTKPINNPSIYTSPKAQPQVTPTSSASSTPTAQTSASIKPKETVRDRQMRTTIAALDAYEQRENDRQALAGIHVLQPERVNGNNMSVASSTTSVSPARNLSALQSGDVSSAASSAGLGTRRENGNLGSVDGHGLMDESELGSDIETDRARENMRASMRSMGVVDRESVGVVGRDGVSGRVRETRTEPRRDDTVRSHGHGTQNGGRRSGRRASKPKHRGNGVEHIAGKRK